ncbi:unnamed protein product [Diabrotica balteata]|uniref:Uncharacterized protein n=1 Tax=Diabrotica balteata TaxID=107213 RepID=A0A9N9X8U3_DIABA|nr:unnamed protein product [Diabrotica balteata]
MNWHNNGPNVDHNSYHVSSSTCDSPSSDALVIDEDRDTDTEPLQELDPLFQRNHGRRLPELPNNQYLTQDRRNQPSEFRNSRRTRRNKSNPQGKENINMANGNGYQNHVNGYNQSREYYNQTRQPLSPSAYNPKNYFKSKTQDEEIREPKGYSYKANKYLETYDRQKEAEIKNQIQTQDFYNTHAVDTLQPNGRQASDTLPANKDSYCTPENRAKEINSQQAVIEQPIHTYNGSHNNSNISKLPAVQKQKEEIDYEIINVIDEIQSEHEILKKSLEEKHAAIIRHALQNSCAPQLSQESMTDGTNGSTNSVKDEVLPEDSQENQTPTKPKGRRKNLKSKNSTNEFVEVETPPRFMQNRPPFQYQYPIPPSAYQMAGMHPLHQMYAMHSALQQNQSYNIPNNFVPPQSYTTTRTMSYYNVPNSMQSMYTNGIHPAMNYMNNYQPYQPIPGQQQNFYQYPIPNYSMYYPETGYVPFRPNHFAGGQYSQQIPIPPGQPTKEDAIPLPEDVYSCQVRTKKFIAEYKNGEYVLVPEEGEPNGTANYSEN